MKALSPGGPGRQQPWMRPYPFAPATVLLAALLTLASVALTNLRPSCDKPEAAFPEIDSFSEPAIALAVLKLKVDRVFQDCIQDWDARYPNPSGASGSAPPQADTPLARLQQLHQQIEALASDVDDKLMTVSARQGRANDFVERYLDRLSARSDNGSVGLLASTALLFAERCQRTAELLHAMEEFSAFHPELKPSLKLERAVDEWRAKAAGSLDERSQ